MKCPECGSSMPAGAELCPNCISKQTGTKQNQSLKIVVSISGLLIGTLISLALLPIAGEVIFFYAIWILPALLCVLGYNVGKRQDSSQTE